MGITMGRNMGKKTPLIICLTVLILLTAGICFTFFVYLSSPGFGADDKVTLSCDSGKYELSWNRLNDKQDEEYVVEVYEGIDDNALDGDPIYATTYKWWDMSPDSNKCSLILPEDVLAGGARTFYINTKRFITVLGGDVGKRGKAPIIAQYDPHNSADFSADYKVDTASGRITFSCVGNNSGVYKLYLTKSAADIQDSEDELIDEISDAGDQVKFEESFNGEGFAIPEAGQTYIFTVACEAADSRLIIGYNRISLDREDFLTDKVSVVTKDDGKNRYTFTWNETKGDGYKVSLLDDGGTWRDIKEYSVNDERIFETGKLKPCTDYMYRVEAVDTPADVSEEDRICEIDIHTLPSVEYASVWPTENIAVYKSSSGDEQVGTLNILQCVTVLDEKDDRFLIETGAGDDSISGYIDSNKCMINLPDYIGDLCKYDITNSYCSIYLAHNYGIPAVSGTVVSGYEHVLLDDGTFLVPLLYPVAKKLVPAAEDARDKGYVIKIYDSFRPYVATRSIYDLTYEALYYVVPSNDYARISLKDYMSGKSPEILSLSNMKKAEPVTEEDDDDKDSKKDKKSKKKKSKKKKSTKVVYKETTYAKVMLNDGAYDLGAFLAAKGSMHNLGIAMDMTIESLESGEELTMQSAMHDLSYHSIQASNNDNANILKNIMVPQGFSMITSEWWHFQDNDVRDTLHPASVENGVSIEGWKKDDNGWRYQTEDGKFYKRTKETIGDSAYSFDEDGYVE